MHVHPTRSVRIATRLTPLICAVLATACGGPAGGQEETLGAGAGWIAYGGDPGGSRYSTAHQVTRDNVAGLQMAWTLRTGEVNDHAEGGPDGTPGASCSRCHASDTKFEATPIVADGRLFISTPLNRVIAADPGTGEELWRYDPGLDLDLERSEGFVSRGVSYWASRSASGATCDRRVFMGTVDARLIALDAATGVPCAGFGESGTIHLDEGVGEVQAGQYGLTSPPAVVEDVVVVGSSMGDNRRVDMERGTVRGYDARSGSLVWAWDPIPRSADDPGWDEWSPEAASKTGAANAWAPLAADVERDMVFIPTGSAAPDFYGGERPGSNIYANSIVALRASTGDVLWYFQVVHHDLWDYDIPSQPALTTVMRGGTAVPAVAVATKMGHLFLLNRETGESLFPMEERAVPPSDVPGERTSPTQPFPVLPPPLHPTTLSADDAWGATPDEQAYCRQQIEPLRAGGIFTPPSLEGTLLYPGYGGGMGWGSMAVDHQRSVLVTGIMRLAMWVRLHPREPGSQSGNQRGTPYTMTRGVLVAPSGLPCSPPPWSTLTAVDLVSGDVKWEIPLGVVPELAEFPGSDRFGSPHFGGPLVTAGGLVFIAAGMDDHIRAHDIDTGVELWQADLPAGGQATPMTYEFEGRQYIVIAAGGHGNLGTTQGDYVVAFALR